MPADGARPETGGAAVKVLIVGASVGGVATAAALRANGFDGEIVLASAESEMPYDKPPLSKQFLAGAWPEERLWLRPDDFYREQSIQVRLRHAAMSLDVRRKTVQFATAAETYDALVIATGLTARRLAGPGRLDGLCSLRTLADARLLRGVLATGEPLAIVGGGFIGLEVAACATELGVLVTVVEPQPEPLAGPLGVEVGRRIRRLHEEHGVNVLTGVGVVRPIGGHRLDGLELTDGRRLEARHAVVGIGSIPNTGWLADSGVRLDDGVLCDERCRAYGAESIYAVGDVARRQRRGERPGRRVEHWTNAVDQAEISARAIMNMPGADAAEPVPYFWSHQFGTRLQFVGSSKGAERTVAVDGGSDGHVRNLTIFASGAHAIGALAWNWPTAAGRVKKLLRKPITVEEICEQTPSSHAVGRSSW
jgi:phthalate 3,4-dioxygenase ferredoxin reductase component